MAWGSCSTKMNRFKEAETALREALHLREQLAARFPDDPASSRALADSRYYLGALLARLANPRPEDKELYHQAIKDQEALLATKPDLPENRVKLSQYLNNLAILEARTDPARAEREYRKILDLLAGLDRTQGTLAGRPVAGRTRFQQPGQDPGSRTGKGQASKSAEAFLIKARDRARSSSSPSFPEFFSIGASWHRSSIIWDCLGRDREQAELAVRIVPPGCQPAQTAGGQVSPGSGLPAEPGDRAVPAQPAQNRHRSGGAEPALAQVLDDQERLIASYPDVPDYRNALGRNLFDYGKLLFERGDRARAATLIEQSRGANFKRL